MKPAHQVGFFGLQTSFLSQKKRKNDQKFLLFVLFLRNKFYFLSFEFIKTETSGVPRIAASGPMILEASFTVDVAAINEDTTLILSKSIDLNIHADGDADKIVAALAPYIVE